MNQLTPSTPSTTPESFGRYLLYPAIARGGMATVHTARLVGAEGFTRLVAAKRLHPQFTDDPDFVTMFHDEACIASRIHHPNVVPVLDVVVTGSELILVQEYVHGVPLSQLMKIAQLSEQPIAIDVVVAVLQGVLAGLHAAHEVKDEADRPLEIVHRDVSPQNVMISVDGIPRLLDFGIAKARTSTHHTREGVFKGKLAYMAPEQLRMEDTNRTIDVYAAGVLAWEMLVNRRVYDGRHDVAFVTAVMSGEIPPITSALEEQRRLIDRDRWNELVALEPVVSRAMAALPEDRYATADEMLHALLEVRPSATSMTVAEWVRAKGSDFLDERQKTLAANEESWRRTSVYRPTPSSGVQPIKILDVSIEPALPPPLPPPRLSPLPSPVAAPMPFSVTPLPLLATAPPPVASRRADRRMLRLLPWIGAGLFIFAGLVGGILRGVPAESAPVAIISTPNAPSTVSPASSAAPIVAAEVVYVPSIPPPPSQTAAPAPPRPPPPVAHWTPPPRQWTPPTPAPSPATTPKSDCNPPFFFEGTKKVFKPSCL